MIDGLIVTDGIGITVRIVHSGLNATGFTPKIFRSSFGIFSSLILVSIGDIFFSSSMNVVGFSSIILNCFALQYGHWLTVFNSTMISLILSLLAVSPPSSSDLSKSSKHLSIFCLGINILPQSLHVHLNRS